MSKIICKILKQWKEESNCPGIIQFKYSYSENKITIYSSSLGYLIGRSGIYYNKYFKLLKNEIHNLKEIELIETDYRFV